MADWSSRMPSICSPLFLDFSCVSCALQFSWFYIQKLSASTFLGKTAWYSVVSRVYLCISHCCEVIGVLNRFPVYLYWWRVNYNALLLDRTTVNSRFADPKFVSAVYLNFSCVCNVPRVGEISAFSSRFGWILPFDTNFWNFLAELGIVNWFVNYTSFTELVTLKKGKRWFFVTISALMFFPLPCDVSGVLSDEHLAHRL